MPFIIMPVPRANGRPTRHQRTMAVLMVICGLFAIPMAVGFIVSPPDCGGNEMHPGDSCVSTDTTTGKVAHTSNYGKERRGQTIGGVVLGTIGIALVYGGQRKFRQAQHRKREAKAARTRPVSPYPLGQQGAALNNAYANQIARHAQGVPSGPASAAPPPPAPAPTLHHDA